MLLSAMEAKVRNGERLQAPEGRFLLSEECGLALLGAWAQWKRFQMHPERRVTFVADSNPNYTNVCDTACAFCAFSRRASDPDAYTLPIDEVVARARRAAEQGATTLLLQGGLNRELPLSYYTGLITALRREFPGLTPHCFSAPEIRAMAEGARKSVEEVLKILWEAGLRTLPGGGAEVLSKRVRENLSPRKGGPECWLDVHRAAHRLGYKSTATLMYGHIETAEDIVEHWESLRALQDETRGFTAFVPWSFKPGGSSLARRVPCSAGPVSYLRIVAASRLYLDNFPHIQASWFSEGKKAGQAALHFGADDFGGTLYEENVHAASGFSNRATLEEVKTLIRSAGFAPVQRTTLYELMYNE